MTQDDNQGTLIGDVPLRKDSTLTDIHSALIGGVQANLDECQRAVDILKDLSVGLSETAATIKRLPAPDAAPVIPLPVPVLSPEPPTHDGTGVLVPWVVFDGLPVVLSPEPAWFTGRGLSVDLQILSGGSQHDGGAMRSAIYVLSVEVKVTDPAMWPQDGQEGAIDTPTPADMPPGKTGEIVTNNLTRGDNAPIVPEAVMAPVTASVAEPGDEGPEHEPRQYFGRNEWRPGWVVDYGAHPTYTLEAIAQEFGPPALYPYYWRGQEQVKKHSDPANLKRRKDYVTINQTMCDYIMRLLRQYGIYEVPKPHTGRGQSAKRSGYGSHRR